MLQILQIHFFFFFPKMKCKEGFSFFLKKQYFDWKQNNFVVEWKDS